MKVGVRVLLRPEVLDIQGRAVAETLSRSGLLLKDCRVGRYIIVDIDKKNKTEAFEVAKKMAETVLANPLIETFELEEVEAE
ncbi:MAG: phosphoribosylformylglycinamidine synthase subunit PurS [Bdellovibrionales bacterium]